MKSWISNWLSYFTKRLLLMRIGILWLVLLAMAWMAAPPADWGNALVDLVLSGSLIGAFRLWDDLADVEIDRQRDPKSILANASSLAPFVVLFLLLAAVTLSVTAVSKPAFSAYLAGALYLLMAFWYAMPFRADRQVFNYHLVLLKYPGFVAMLAWRDGAARLPAIGLAMACIYLLMCVYEVWHDARLWSRRLARVLAGIETVAILGLLCLGLQWIFW